MLNFFMSLTVLVQLYRLWMYEFNADALAILLFSIALILQNKAIEYQNKTIEVIKNEK